MFVIPPHLIQHSDYRKRAILQLGDSKSILDITPSLDLSAYPIELAHSTLQGLHLIASRDLEPGEIVLKEAPSVATVRPEAVRLGKYCSSCFGKIDKERMEEWKLENDDSTVLCQTCQQDYPRLSILDKKWLNTWNQLRDERLVKLQDGEDHEDYEFEHLDDGLWRLFTRTIFGWYGQRREGAISTDPDHLWILETPQHLDTITEHQIHLLIDGVLDSHARIIHDSEEISKLKKLLRIVFHNAHEVCDGDLSIGWALFPIASLLNHSCQPNCTWKADVEDDGTFVCKSNKQIKQGEELTIAYAQFPGISQRELYLKQSYMLKTWKFSCHCQECQRCWYCSNKNDLKKCSKCKVALYCSKECQEKDFREGDACHKKWCETLQKSV